MSKISSSPDRHLFQKKGYVDRQTERDEPINEDYLNLFKQIINDHSHRFDDPSSRIDNLEYDLLTTDWICKKVRDSKTYAQNLYAALCNQDFVKLEVINILKEDTWSCSWRHAGGIIADMREEGDYIDWYCSGIRDMYDNGYVPEGHVTDEIRSDLTKLGWMVFNQRDDY